MLGYNYALTITIISLVLHAMIVYICSYKQKVYSCIYNEGIVTINFGYIFADLLHIPYSTEVLTGELSTDTDSTNI